MQDARLKSLRALLIYWYKADIQAIVTWIGKCNEKYVSVNYKAWTTGNHTKKAGWLLQKIGLKRKKGITKKKATDKLADMMKSYKNMIKIANCTGWGMEEAKH